MNITVKQLTAFLRVAEIGSFTRASEHFGVAQPALSMLIRDLEAELKLRLFDRTTRMVVLTEAGREFRKSASRIVEELESAVRGAHEFSQRRKGRVVVAAPPLLAAVMLPFAIVEFERDYPGIKIVLADVATERIIEMVRSGEADLGVGTFPNCDAEVDSSLVLRDSLLVFCARTSDLARLRTVSWRDLLDQPLITLTRDSGIRTLIEAGLQQSGTSIEPKFEVSHITTALSLMDAGLGIAVLPAYAWAAIRTHNIVARRLVQPELSREVSVVKARDRSLSPGSDAFMPFLLRHARRAVPPDSSFSM
jgi:DNA-binding transcriptional LysR family regulator